MKRAATSQLTDAANGNIGLVEAANP